MGALPMDVRGGDARMHGRTAHEPLAAPARTQAPPGAWPHHPHIFHAHGKVKDALIIPPVMNLRAWSRFGLLGARWRVQGPGSKGDGECLALEAQARQPQPPRAGSILPI